MKVVHDYIDIEANLLLLRYLIIRIDSQLIEQIIKRDWFKASNTSQFNELTDREVEILQLLASGLNNPMIADELLISRHTVETHRKNLNRKLDIKSYCRLVKFALAFDLVRY